jgi:hypothetical protein
MTNSATPKKEILLAFPHIEEDSNEDFVSKGGEGIVKYFTSSLDDILGWFKQYEVDTIEISISGTAGAGNVLKLLVDAKGEGGIKVTLRPKKS